MVIPYADTVTPTLCWLGGRISAFRFWVAATPGRDQRRRWESGLHVALGELLRQLPVNCSAPTSVPNKPTAAYLHHMHRATRPRPCSRCYNGLLVRRVISANVLMDKKMDGQNNFDLITDHLLIPIFRQASFATHHSILGFRARRFHRPTGETEQSQPSLSFPLRFIVFVFLRTGVNDLQLVHDPMDTVHGPQNLLC